MKIAKEIFDESCAPGEPMPEECHQTGVVFTFTQGKSKLIIRIDYRTPTVGRLMEPQGWYIDLFESDFFREASDYLKQHTQVQVIAAYRTMTRGVYEHRIDG